MRLNWKYTKCLAFIEFVAQNLEIYSNRSPFLKHKKFGFNPLHDPDRSHMLLLVSNSFKIRFPLISQKWKIHDTSNIQSIAWWIWLNPCSAIYPHHIQSIPSFPSHLKGTSSSRSRSDSQSHGGGPYKKRHGSWMEATKTVAESVKIWIHCNQQKWEGKSF